MCEYKGCESVSVCLWLSIGYKKEYHAVQHNLHKSSKIICKIQNYSDWTKDSVQL